MKAEAYKVETEGYETALFLRKLDAEEHAHKMLAAVSVISKITALYPPLHNEKGVGIAVMISIEELIANKGSWEDLIRSHVEDARDSLTYEIFLNGDLHIDEYRRTGNAAY
jgi:hypothetical protein